MRSWRGMATLYRHAGFVSIVTSDPFTLPPRATAKAFRSHAGVGDLVAGGSRQTHDPTAVG